MVPAKVLRELGLSNTAYRTSSDYDLTVIAARYPVTILLQRLVRWRYHPLSASGPAERRMLEWSIEGVEILKPAAASWAHSTQGERSRRPRRSVAPDGARCILLRSNKRHRVGAPLPPEATHDEPFSAVRCKFSFRACVSGTARQTSEPPLSDVLGDSVKVGSLIEDSGLARTFLRKTCSQRSSGTGRFRRRWPRNGCSDSMTKLSAVDQRAELWRDGGLEHWTAKADCTGSDSRP